MSIVVEVTKDDIRQGVRKDACQCPIAIAITRAIKSQIEDSTGIEPEDMSVEVDFDDIRYWNHDISGDEFNLFPVDEEDWYEIKNFIENFDLGNDVEPFVVELKYN
tara:strand:- start:774 stop:1091 length:318 start_codon:yes stop_codon:yes gene_type:complete